MLVNVVKPPVIELRTRLFIGFSTGKRLFSANSTMGTQQIHNLNSPHRLINVSGYPTEVIEIHSQYPKLHILFIPGNPGIISFYTQFLDKLYDLHGGTASVTGIGHLSHSGKSAAPGRLFSLQEQIDHKIDFVEQELHDNETPLVLVGHSIGSYISLELFKRYQQKVLYCICLYPFLVVNPVSREQSIIRKIALSRVLCVALSSVGTLFGKLPAEISKFIVRKSIGKSWSSSAVQALHLDMLQYHTIRNALFMAMTEFEKLPKSPDWDFMRAKNSQIGFLFGNDDHWGPLHLYEEIRKQVSGIQMSVEREGHTHAFSCTEAGSVWVAHHVSTLIKSHLAKAWHSSFR